jgi:predicted Zn-dependent peptidase
LVVANNPTADIVAARLFWPGGMRAESTQQAGLSNLMAALLTKGTQHRDAFAISSVVESMGALFSADSAPDYFVLSLKSVAADFAALFAIAAESIRTPAFTAAELVRERYHILQGLRAQQEHPFAVAFDRLRRALYGNHPYAFPIAGLPDTVDRLNREAVLAYYHAVLRPGTLTIAIAGRLEEVEAVTLVQEMLGDWQTSAAPIPFAAVPDVPQPTTLSLERNTQQAIVMVGYRVPCVQSPAYAALQLLATYLGGGLSSRLFVELREKQGLAYEVAAHYPTRSDASHLMAYLGTVPQRTAIALEGVCREFARLADRPLTASELEGVKRKLLGQYALAKQTNGQVAQVLGWYATLGLGVEFDRQYPAEVELVTAHDLQAIAQTYLKRPVVSLVGPAAALECLEPAIAQVS